MTAPVHRTTVPGAVGVNRERIRILEAIPQPVRMLPPQQMGAGSLTVSVDTGATNVRLRGASVFRPFPGESWTAGIQIEADYFHHAGPTWDYMGVRLHEVSGLVLDDYKIAQPQESAPFAGYGTTSPPGTLAAPGGNWNGSFYMFVGVCNSSGATAHFKLGTGSIVDADEQYGFDTPSGHVGYSFYNITASEVGAMVTTFSAGTGSMAYTAMNRGSDTGAIIGSMVGEDDTNGFLIKRIALTGSIAAGDAIIVVCASEDIEGDPNFSESWGRANIRQLPDAGDYLLVQQLPHWYDAVNNVWWPLARPSEGIGG